jgi:hypothetical protein
VLCARTIPRALGARIVRPARGGICLAQNDWIAVGDALSERGRLEEALAAYAHEDGMVGLQRRAWVTFLLDRTPEAIASYEALLDRPGLERRMHDEALMMLGAMFADTDWNRDGLTDSISAIDRLDDASLIRQDAPYLAALHFETARALYLQSRDPAAIALLAVALARWPPPANGTPLVPACRRHRARPTTLRGEDPAVRQATDALCATLAP